MSGRDFVDYPFDDAWKMQVQTHLFTGFQRHRNQPAEWMGEVAIHPSFRVDKVPDPGDLEDVVARSAAAWCQALGWLVGERPRVDLDRRTVRAGRVSYAVTCLVSVPPYWEPPAIPGQQSLWGAA